VSSERAHYALLLSPPQHYLVMPHNILETINELIAGSFGGAAQVLVGQPLDTIKTRAQIAPSSVRTFMPQTHNLTMRISCNRGHVCQCWTCIVLSRWSDCASQKGPMDILARTVRKEGVLALYKGSSLPRLRVHDPFPTSPFSSFYFPGGMTSPLLGIAGVNSLLFAAYGTSKRIISPFGQLSLKQTAAAGAMAGAANAILASPVEMFKVRMQGQYGNPTDKRLRVVAREMWAEWGFRKGIMRGYWVRFPPPSPPSKVSPKFCETEVGFR
jgi:solute carrier family 25 (mitochondrial carnitine/acylcarnitine transporter), member 20/29